MSVTDYNLLRPKNHIVHWVWGTLLNCLRRIKHFMRRYGFTFAYAVSIVVFSYLVGLLTAVLLNKKLRGPLALSHNHPVAVGDCAHGDGDELVVVAQRSVWPGQPGARAPWNCTRTHFILATKPMARVTVILVGVVEKHPFMTITLLAGMQSINADLYEAARIDGANGIKSFWHITLPLIQPVAVVSGDAAADLGL